MVKLRKTKFNGIFLVDNKLATINLVPGEKAYGEQLIKVKNVEYREWVPFRSKPAAAIKKNLKVFPVTAGQKILYLGCGSGTTCSHLSDIIGKEGIIYAVDIAEKPLKDLVRLAEIRQNIVPIFADCRKPEEYENIVLDKVHFVYEDIADVDQISILIRNCKKFLKSEQYAAIAIKSQSISSVKPSKEVYKECLEKLEKYFEILDKVELDPYQKRHLFVVMKLR